MSQSHSSSGSDNSTRTNADYFGVMYDQLRRTAQQIASGDRVRSYSGSDLVHFAAEKLLSESPYPSHAAFHAAFTTTAKRIVVDRARARKSLKRGGGWRRDRSVELDRVSEQRPSKHDWNVFDHALQRLDAAHPDEAKALRGWLFGVSSSCIAEEMGVSVATVNRWIASAKLHLRGWVEERRHVQ